MLILGTTNDDTGAQLEQLTRALLENRDYQNLKLNIAGSGGQEIDVTGEQESQVPGNNQLRRLICECKAYRNPINMTDWLKFLGKLYSEQRRTQRELDGLFIALSGANGNVIGNYDELRHHNTPVTLIEGEELLAEVYRAYPDVAPRDDVLSGIERMTSRRHISIDLAYRAGRFFWVVVYPDSKFTVCSAKGNAIDENQEPEVIELLQERLSVSEFLPLSEEARLRDTRNRLEKLFVTKIAENNGSITRTELAQDSGEDENVVDEALVSLEGHSWITMTKDVVSIGRDGIADAQSFGEATLHLMTGRVPGELARRYFSSEFFETHIHDEFLDHIGTIQGNLPIDAELRSLLLRVLPLSPSACVHCLTPQGLIVTHRQNQPEVSANIDDSHDLSILKRIVLQGITADFEQRGLYEFLYEVKGLREIDTRQSIVIKTAQEPILSEEVRIRHGIGAAADSLGGGHIGILILDTAPEPWEEGGVGYAGPQSNEQGQQGGAGNV